MIVRAGYTSLQDEDSKIDSSRHGIVEESFALSAKFSAVSCLSPASRSATGLIDALHTRRVLSRVRCLAFISPPGADESIMISRIVVPTDFSPHADAALELATRLAKMSGATIGLVHVVENPVEGGAWSGGLYAVPVEAKQNALVEDAERRLKSLVSGLPAEFATGSWVRTGDVASTIVSFAREQNADLIAMGTAGRTGLDHLIIGSAAEHVVRYAPCPVLTVRAASPERTPALG